jgi:hypothetical protein
MSSKYFRNGFDRLTVVPVIVVSLSVPYSTCTILETLYFNSFQFLSSGHLVQKRRSLYEFLFYLGI